MDSSIRMGYRVCDVMTRKPVAVSPNISVYECAKIMKEKKVGSLCVKEQDKLLGYITEQGIIHKMVAKNLDIFKYKAKDVMFDKLITIGPEQDLSEALLKMRVMKIRQLPVIDSFNNNKLVGLLTLNDIINIQPQLFEILIEKIKADDMSVTSKYPLEGMCDSCSDYSTRLFEVNDDFLCEKCRNK